MKPEDDSMWPICTRHSVRHWCSGVREYMVEGRDADDIQPGLRYCVPIQPDEFEMYAEVAVDEEVVPGFVYNLYLVVPKSENPFSTDEEMELLGLWTKGEGRLAMAATIRDWADAHGQENCTSTRHFFAREIELQKMRKQMDPETFDRLHTWCTAYYKCCILCHRAAPDGPSGETPSFNASDFGVTPDVGYRNGVPTGPAQSRARDVLQSRYGNR